MALDHEYFMRRAMAQAELARGTTGDNPWVGCVIVDGRGEIVAEGHTQGPGEDHAEISAVRKAKAVGIGLQGTTMYSTLEPCSFHGRTPACSRVIAQEGIGLLVAGMRDPHPRVDGTGLQILRDAGIEVLEGVCEGEIRRQLGSWVFTFHPHEPLRRAKEMGISLNAESLITHLANVYGVEETRVVAAGCVAFSTTRHYP
jgi:diaminohydroxyphosphoribosylaminopyrimidine deaminase / 5-amino-6-(5-phosphoribosylamino)uracil reductase